MDVLHDKPVDGLLVLDINTRGLDELGLQLWNGVWMGVGIEVNGDCVYHCESVQEGGVKKIGLLVQDECLATKHILK